MRHLNGVRKFNKTSEHRRAMFSNMMTSFFRHERITTTVAKAKELRSLSEKVITRAKVNTLHNKRVIMKRIHDRDIIAKLFDEIAPKYKERNGGYTRIVKLGNRAGDAADLALIELISTEGGAEAKPTSKRSAKKKAAGKKIKDEKTKDEKTKKKETEIKAAETV
jgi:large subunit ribosomal protein L17